MDGTDFQRSQTNRDWYSHKFKRSGLRYEVALSILGGDICWICGPWKPGVYNDVMIFREALATWLEPGERVEADDGYVGEAPLRVKCPKSMTESVEKEIWQSEWDPAMKLWTKDSSSGVFWGRSSAMTWFITVMCLLLFVWLLSWPLRMVSLCLRFTTMIWI